MKVLGVLLVIGVVWGILFGFDDPSGDSMEATLTSYAHDEYGMDDHEVTCEKKTNEDWTHLCFVSLDGKNIVEVVARNNGDKIAFEWTPLETPL